MPLPTGVTEADVENALKHAHRYAKRKARGSAALEEVAVDSATDAVVWACKHFKEAKGIKFGSYASLVVARFVWRGIAARARVFHSNPVVGLLSESVPAPARETLAAEAVPLPLAVRELPAELRDTVRLFFVDRFDIREIGLLMGCGAETARQRLRRAANLLAADHTRHRPKMAGARRIRR